MSVSIQKIDQQLEKLRQEWKTAQPSMKPIILRQARSLLNAKELHLKNAR